VSVRDRLSHLPRRRWVAAITALLLVVGTALVIGRVADGPSVPDVTDTEDAVPTPPPPVPLTSLEGGFDASSPTADGWTAQAGSGARTEVTRTTVRSGRGALRMDTSGTRESATMRSRAHGVRPGQEYGASGFAITVSGRPQLSLEFLDQQGRVVDSASTDAADGVGAWSRTTVERVAPADAARMRVVLTVDADAAVVWDDLDWWTTAVADAGFEAAGDSADSARSWVVSRSDGTSVRRVTAGARTGRAAIELRDTSRRATALAASSLVPVPQGTELEVSGWARAVRGKATLRVGWYDAARAPLAATPTNGVAADGSAWSEVGFRTAVPDGAAYGQVRVSTSREARATVLWDDVSLRPAAPATEQTYAVSPAATMTGFANTKTSLVTSVRGVPKFSTVASGSPAVFQVADLRTGRVEFTAEIPGILNGWALTNSLDQRAIFIGGQGHVWRYDTTTRTLTDLGAATPRATRVFDLVTAPDGRIWGGSYPGGEVWSLDPATGKFTSAGSVGNDNDYARTLAVDGSHLYVGTGSVHPNIVQISTADPAKHTQIAPPPEVRTGFLTQLKVHAGVLSVLFPDGSRGLYDLTGRAWVDAPELATTGNLYQATPGAAAPDNRVYFFRDGRFWGATLGPEGVTETALATVPVPTSVGGRIVRMALDGAPADWVLAYDSHTRLVAHRLGAPDPATGLAVPETRPRVINVRLRPTALRVKSLAESAGKVVVGGYGGSSLSILDPATLGTPADRGLVRTVGGASTPKFFGEVEGMVTNGRYQYFGTYPKSRIFRLDTTQPWADRTNPRLLADLGATTSQDRPIAWAASPSRTFFGTIPDYGIRGGALGWFEGTSARPVVVDPPVPEQSVVGLSADRSTVYGSTSRWGGLGARPSSGPPSVFKYDSDRKRVLWTVTPDRSAQSIGSVLHDDEGRLWAASRNRILQLDPVTGRTIRTISLGITGDPAGDDPDDGDPANATFVSTAMVSLRDHLYLASGGEVWQLDPRTSRVRRISDGGVSPSRIAVVGDDLYYPATTVVMRAEAQ